MENNSLLRLGVDLDPSKKWERFEHPHLQKVASLVYLLLAVRSRVSDGLANGERFEEFFADHKGLTRAEHITQRIMAVGNPFGFSGDLTRAILEMADYFFENQYNTDLVKNAPYVENWDVKPEEYLDITMDSMYLLGHNVHPNSFQPNTFPASKFYAQIFPPEAARQMAMIVDGKVSID